MGAHQEIREMIVRDLHFTGSRSELTDSYGLLDNAVIDSMGIFKLVGLLEERSAGSIAADELHERVVERQEPVVAGQIGRAHV